MDFKLIAVLIISALPLSESTGGIPLALFYGFSPLEAYLISVLGNILPVPILFLLLEYLVGIATKIKSLNKIYRAVVERVEKKKDVVERYGYPGLVFFVALPWPTTGAWTATLLAFLLQLNRLKAVVSISIGICFGGIIILLISLGIIRIVL